MAEIENGKTEDTLIAEFVEMVEKHKESLGIDYSGCVWLIGKIPDKKAINMRASFQIPEDEKIVMLFDQTVFGSAKEGMALTTRGIWHKAWQKVWGLSWGQFVSTPYFVFTPKEDGASYKLPIRNSSGGSFTDEKTIELAGGGKDGTALLEKILPEAATIFAGLHGPETEEIQPAEKAAIPPILLSNTEKTDETAALVKCSSCKKEYYVTSAEELERTDLHYECGDCHTQFDIAFFGTCRRCKKTVGFYPNNILKTIAVDAAKLFLDPLGTLAKGTKRFFDGIEFAKAAGICPVCEKHFAKCHKCGETITVPKGADLKSLILSCEECDAEMHYPFGGVSTNNKGGK